MPARIKTALLYLLAAYWIVTILGFLLTVAFTVIFNPPSPQELGLPAAQAPAYTMTEPYHPLLNLLVFPGFGWLYLRGLPAGFDRRREALRLGTLWVATTMVVDLIGWVLIPHPWAMTLKGFYIDYQPWITLIYLVIFASPLLALWITSARKVAVAQ